LRRRKHDDGAPKEHSGGYSSGARCVADFARPRAALSARTGPAAF
jgi:hypothetical protein